MTKYLKITYIIAAVAVILCTVPMKVNAGTGIHAPKRDYNGNVSYSQVYFGSYPQREVVSKHNKAQMAALNSRTASYKVVSAAKWRKIVKANYNKNGDARVGGVKYRRIKATDATQRYDYDEPSMYKWLNETSYHYFIYEPIKWRVLEYKNGKAMLLSEYALDDVKYNEKVSWNIKWKNSTVRSWMNGYGSNKNSCGINYTSKNFIDTAFTATQQRKILKNRIASGAKDKVFLLSESDVFGGSKAYGHGFSKRYSEWDESRRCKCTTYAFAKGIYRSKETPLRGNVWWWLRSPNYGGDSSSYVEYGGDVSLAGQNMDKDAGGIRPAIMVKKSTLKALKCICSN